MPTSGAPAIPTGFIVLIVIIVILGVAGMIWRAVVLTRGGLNPFVAREQLEVQLTRNLREAAGSLRDADGPSPAQPAKSVEERLAELDELRGRGVITAEERAAGRAKIIGGD